MEHEYEYNYADIDAYVHRANQMRSEALSQMLTAGWVTCKRLCLQLVQRKKVGAQVVKQSSTRGLAY
ncbi:MAG: hypothetical protein GW848_03915 [Rhodoferax sp.]|nr:hypothetical protein [Rhodoferax sp.]OIP21701.1 MAG: hypothetical protein AUK52_07870 [Comamonadaceae bacterium CG2_30_60_41]PIW09243.1 MAG: hypothetical protein COW39_06010 [Comamonadaceae bacterium CG17_big_fil_post_rev_8_21_14_2_50_60_13]PIY24065.1 MAG: hypothetical protein COZ10_07940 [Comamonadaceae bacterium CG_4_10_14_3_um_filter_60_75]PJC13234.1 MAG: hypothetical protein CO066_08295 [Comamonadaceae bacterium CG_4_9_14_0_8_um_filter_60_18]